MIKLANSKDLLERNLLFTHEDTSKQRNYITHNIHALFTELIDETMMPENDLIDTDVLKYTEKDSEITNNLIDLADLISKY